MPETCLKRLPYIFQSKNRQQKAIKKVWEVIQDGLHVSKTYIHMYLHIITYPHKHMYIAINQLTDYNTCM